MSLSRTRFASRLASYQSATQLSKQPLVEGRLIRMVGLTLEAQGLQVSVGSRCLVINNDGYQAVQVEAEVMGFSSEKVFLMPLVISTALLLGARVVPIAGTDRMPIGLWMLGRVLDGAGSPLDDKGRIEAEEWVQMEGPAINPLQRHPISEPLDVGIRSINGLLTVGRGQRLGLLPVQGWVKVCCWA